MSLLPRTTLHSDSEQLSLDSLVTDSLGTYSLGTNYAGNPLYINKDSARAGPIN
jgi:hypothetical protein